MSQPTAFQQYLLGLVNARLNTALTIDVVRFEPVQMIDATVLDLSNPSKRNSSVRIYTDPGYDPSVNLTVAYNRLQLTKLFSLRNPSFTDAGEATTGALITKLANLSGVAIGAEDIIDEPIVRSGSSPYSVEIKAKADSPRLFGSVVIELVGEAVEPVTTNFTLERTPVYKGSPKSPAMRLRIVVPSDGAADDMILTLRDTTGNDGVNFHIPIGPSFNYGAASGWDQADSSQWVRPAWLNWGLDNASIGLDDTGRVVPLAAFPNGAFRFSLKTGTVAGTYDIVIPVDAINIDAQQTYTVVFTHEGVEHPLSIPIETYEEPVVAISINPANPLPGDTVRVSGSITYPTAYVPDNLNYLMVTPEDTVGRARNFTLSSGLSYETNPSADANIYIRGLTAFMASGRYNFAFDLDINPDLAGGAVTTLDHELRIRSRDTSYGSLNITLGEEEGPIEPGGTTLNYRMTPKVYDTFDVNGEVIPDVLILDQVSPTEWDILGVTNTDNNAPRDLTFQPGSPTGLVSAPGFVEPAGLIRPAELENLRRYAPVSGGYATTQTGYLIPDDATAVTLTAKATTDIDNAWMGKLAYLPFGDWGRSFPSSELEELGVVLDEYGDPDLMISSADLLPPGERVFQLNAPLPAKVQRARPALMFRRADSRPTIIGPANWAEFYLDVYRVGGSWWGDLSGGMDDTTTATATKDDATVTISQDVDSKNIRIEHVGFQSNAVEMRAFFTSADPQPAIKLTVVSISHPVRLTDVFGSSADVFNLTEAGQIVELPAGYSPGLETTFQDVGGDAFSVEFAVEVNQADPSAADQVSSLNVEFTSLAFTGHDPNDRPAAVPYRLPLGSWSWDIQQRVEGTEDSLMMAAPISLHRYGGIVAVDSGLNSYIERLIPSNNNPEPSEGYVSDGVLPMQKGWYSGISRITAYQDATLPSDWVFPSSPRQRAAGLGGHLGAPYFVLSQMEGMLIEFSSESDLADGLKWLYVPHFDAGLSGMGAINLTNTVAMKMIANDARTSVFFNGLMIQDFGGSPNFTQYKAEVAVGVNTVPNEFIQTQLAGAQSCVFAYHNTAHAGKFLRQRLEQFGQNPVAEWLDLPTTDAVQVRLYTVTRQNHSGNNGFVVCVAADGRQWYVNSDDLTPNWISLPVAQFGNTSFEHYRPLALHASQNRLVSWMGGDHDQTSDTIDSVTYDGQAVAAGPYRGNGTVMSIGEQPLWEVSTDVVSFTMQDQVRGMFARMWFPASGSRVLRFGGSLLPPAVDTVPEA